MNIHVAHIVPAINERIGGPAVSVPALAEAIIADGLSTEIFTNNYPEHGSIREVPVPITAFDLPTTGKLLRGWNPAFKKLLHVRAAQFSLIHSHGLWMYPNHYARLIAQQHNIPLIISPRGMLETWARDFHAMRKQLAWFCYERKTIHTASAFHATSKREAETLRSLGVIQPIAIIPNGIEAPLIVSDEVEQSIRIRLKLQPKMRYCLFMSRIHAKKGLTELLTAWKHTHAQYPDWGLIIAGADMNSYLEKAASVLNNDLEKYRINYIGHADPITKEVLFTASELFILPSFSENFGIVIGEALIRGKPVITTNAVPWNIIREENLGWLCDPDIRAIQEVLKNALQENSSELAARGTRAIPLITQQYSWKVIGAQMRQFYSYLTDKSTALPDFLNQ